MSKLEKLMQKPCYDHTQCGDDCLKDCPHYAEKKPEIKSKPAYTKEPWRVVSDLPVMAIYSEPENYRVVQTVNQNNFNTYGKSRVDVGIYKQEDADRIVACVNACAGINTEALEAGLIKYMLKVLIENRMKFPMNWGIPDNEITFRGVKILEESEK